jgi:hypothetical protein
MKIYRTPTEHFGKEVKRLFGLYGEELLPRRPARVEREVNGSFVFFRIVGAIVRHDFKGCGNRGGRIKFRDSAFH